MNKVSHAFRVARRYAEGGSDDEPPPPLIGGPNPIASAIGHRPVLQMDPMAGGAGGAGPIPGGGHPEPIATEVPREIATEAPRQPGASRTGYVSPYGIYGRAQMSDEEYANLKEPEQLSPYEGETYQGVPREEHPFREMDTEAQNAYQKYLHPRFGSIYDFAKKFFSGYDTRNIGFAAAEHPEYGEGSMSFDGTLTEGGNSVAHTSVSINPATNSAHLGLLEIEPPYRGEAGPRLLQSQIDAYKRLGLDYVDLYAAGGGDPYGGSYAWAKYGFVPDKEDWNLMQRRLIQRLDNGNFGQIDPEVATIAKNILFNSDPRSIWRLSDLKAPTGISGQPLGKQMLLSHSWSGALNFKDADAMERFNGYIARPKKPNLRWVAKPESTD